MTVEGTYVKKRFEIKHRLEDEDTFDRVPTCQNDKMMTNGRLSFFRFFSCSLCLFLAHACTPLTKSIIIVVAELMFLYNMYTRGDMFTLYVQLFKVVRTHVPGQNGVRTYI